MSDSSLERLRTLNRASVLLDHLVTDLAPFVKVDGTFRRTPTSSDARGDVNVTTTCSCLMGLALSDKFKEFYREGYRVKHKDSFTKGADAVFKLLVDAPWMSSGLTANNAFTTALVLRTFGFLQEEKLLESLDANSTTKAWELDVGICDLPALAILLRDHKDLASETIWLSASDKTRSLLSKFTASAPGSEPTDANETLKAALNTDLRNFIQSGWIYKPDVFTEASERTKDQLKVKPTGYVLAEVNHWLIADQYPKAISKPTARSVAEIAQLMASHEDNFSINQYPPSAAVMYWFVDGVARANIRLDEPHWRNLCTWAAKKFNHERSLVVARHASMMDPIAMGMSACLCARLSSVTGLGVTRNHLELLPSMFELERSVEELFALQSDSGLWNKYFPMFHYQDAGSNFCFTFELIEAVLHDFGERVKLFECEEFLRGLEKAVTWCETNRLRYPEGDELYEGWNSGGNIETLAKEQPESWATAVVHMFLWELTNVTSARIQQQIYRKYNAKPKARVAQKELEKEGSSIAGLLDIDVLLPSGRETLSEVLWTKIVKNHAGEDERSLRRKRAKKPVSALLFGPPGTSKTEITKAVAADLNWPFIEITPSNFVKGSLENVYLQADEIFEDLMDLSGVLVFFDEMDALVQTRDVGVQLDVFSQFLTTTMLPKLSRLHDKAQVIFFMATNFQDRFDAAIKRAGRFDLLLCMGPPKLSEKISRIHVVFGWAEKNKQTEKAGQQIEAYLNSSPDLRDQFALLTFGELKSFLKLFLNDKVSEKSIGDDIEALGEEKFRQDLEKYSEYVTLRFSDLEELLKAKNRKRLAELEDEKISHKDFGAGKITQAVRYLCDQGESREQW